MKAPGPSGLEAAPGARPAKGTEGTARIFRAASTKDFGEKRGLAMVEKSLKRNSISSISPCLPLTTRYSRSSPSAAREVRSRSDTNPLYKLHRLLTSSDAL